MKNIYTLLKYIFYGFILSIILYKKSYNYLPILTNVLSTIFDSSYFIFGEIETYRETPEDLIKLNKFRDNYEKIMHIFNKPSVSFIFIFKIFLNIYYKF